MLLYQRALIFGCIVAVMLSAVLANPVAKPQQEPKSAVHAPGNCSSIMNETIYLEKEKNCIECNKVFKTEELLNLCYSDCFTSSYYKGCQEILNPTSRKLPSNQTVHSEHSVQPTV
ncbi:CHH-like protein [Venturia canescens]|uniref:CHH-like protein n=1 Tax=Venturia canescens TaxID=32260 RepID=UPI001C9CB447|nr:CHH-like protein [Venturia canescens]